MIYSSGMVAGFIFGIPKLLTFELEAVAWVALGIACFFAWKARNHSKKISFVKSHGSEVRPRTERKLLRYSAISFISFLIFLTLCCILTNFKVGFFADLFFAPIVIRVAFYTNAIYQPVAIRNIEPA